MCLYYSLLDVVWSFPFKILLFCCYISREIYSFKETTFIQQCCVPDRAEIFIQQFPRSLYNNYKLYKYCLLNEYLKKLLSILQTVSYCSRCTICLLFGSRFHGQNLLQRSQIEVSLYADVSENILLFASQSMNNISRIDISQRMDWGRPSLSPIFS